MTDRDLPETPSADFAGMPMQPTGSGVADLEVAFEQMKLAEAADPDLAAADAAVTPTATDSEMGESEAHPS